MKRTLTYSFAHDRDDLPIVKLDMGFKIATRFTPATLRFLAETLTNIADEAEAQQPGKHADPSSRSVKFESYLEAPESPPEDKIKSATSKQTGMTIGGFGTTVRSRDEKDHQ